MSTYDIPVGDTTRLTTEHTPGWTYMVRVSGSNVALDHRPDRTQDGVVLEDGDRADVSVPAGQVLYAENIGDSEDAEVRVFPQGTNNLSRDDGIGVSITASSKVEVQGQSDVDVVDRQGRNLGKVRVMDSDGTLVDGSNPLPVDIGAGALEIGTWSAGTLPVTIGGNQSNVHTDTLTPSGTGDSFAAQSVPDGATVVYRVDPTASDGVIDLEGFPLDGGESVEIDVDDVSVPTFNGDGNATVHALVEVA